MPLQAFSLPTQIRGFRFIVVYLSRFTLSYYSTLSSLVTTQAETGEKPRNAAIITYLRLI